MCATPFFVVVVIVVRFWLSFSVSLERGKRRDTRISRCVRAVKRHHKAKKVKKNCHCLHAFFLLLRIHSCSRPLFLFFFFWVKGHALYRILPTDSQELRVLFTFFFALFFFFGENRFSFFLCSKRKKKEKICLLSFPLGEFRLTRKTKPHPWLSVCMCVCVCFLFLLSVVSSKAPPLLLLLTLCNLPFYSLLIWRVPALAYTYIYIFIFFFIFCPVSWCSA